MQTPEPKKRGSFNSLTLSSWNRKTILDLKTSLYHYLLRWIAGSLGQLVA